MNKTIKSILIIVAILIVVGVVWYGTSRKPAEKETIKIGAILSLSGTSADAGNYIREGLLLAQDELNNDSSLRYEYQLIFEDSQYLPEKAVTAIQKLIDIDGIRYIIGAYGSSETLAIAPIAEQKKVILITPSSQTTKLSTAGDYIFRTQSTTLQEAKFFSPFLVKQIGSQKLSILAINTDYGVSVINDYSSELKKLGTEIALVQKFDSKETDFRIPLLKIKDAGIKYILLAGTRKHDATILKQAQETNMPFYFLATSVVEGKELIDIVGSLADGLIYPYPYDDRNQDMVAKNFREKYLQKYGYKNEMLSANGYDTLQLISYCLEKVGDNAELVKNCLYGIKDYHGASEVLSFDQNGDVIKPFVLKTIKNGQFVPYED